MGSYKGDYKYGNYTYSSYEGAYNPTYNYPGTSKFQPFFKPFPEATAPASTGG